MKARKRITTVLTIVLLVNGTAFAQDFEFELEHLVPPVPGALTHYAGNHPTAGVDRVRVFWINSDGEAQAISEAQVQGNRDYSGCFFIPEDAAGGNHEILALGIGDPSELVA